MSTSLGASASTANYKLARKWNPLSWSLRCWDTRDHVTDVDRGKCFSVGGRLARVL